MYFAENVNCCLGSFFGMLFYSSNYSKLLLLNPGELNLDALATETVQFEQEPERLPTSCGL